MPRSRHLVWIAVLALLAGTAAAAEPTAPRSFAPVQDGFTADAPQHLPYAPDRLLVQFSTKAMASLAVGTQKGALVTGARTGLARVDALAGNAGVREIVRPYRASADARKAAAFGKDRWFLFRFDGAPDLPRLAAELAADGNVDAVSLDWRAFPAAVPNDPIYPSQWGHDNTGQMLSYDWATHSHENGEPVGTPGFDAHAQEAWDKVQGYGGAGVVIAILDSGVDIDHPDLDLVAGYDFGDNDSNPDDNASGAGHGTACAGIAAAVANNGLGVAGIAGGSVVMPCKVADSGGSMYFSYIQDALYWAADQGADVISMSLGAAISSDAATDAALAYAWNAGCVIVAATGNENASTISYPAIHPDVMGIGAASPCGDRKRSSSSRLEVNSGVNTDPNGYTCDGERWWGSNYGSTTPDDRGAVDILAPTIMPTTDIGGLGGYASGDYDLWFNGTSCATPYAAGVAALVIAANPSFTNAQVWDAMTSTATDVVNIEAGTGWDRYSGYGMVNADAAIGGGTPIAPVADFGGTPTSGTYPLDVAFTDLSSGAPTSWSWNFGDGATASVRNPVHTYAAAGTYTVSLTVANDVGSDTATRTGYITVAAPPAPTAAFSGAPTSGSYPLDVAFTDQSTGSPTSWSWTFGDGGTATVQNPVHTYAAAGTYTVSLTVGNAQGSDTLTRNGYVTVTEPGQTTYVAAGGETSVYGTVGGSFLDTAADDGVAETVTEVLYTGHPVKRYSYLEHRWHFQLPAGGNATFLLDAARSNNADGDNMVFEYSTDGANWTPLVAVSSAAFQAYSVDVGALAGSVTVRVYDTDRSWGLTSLDVLSVDYMVFQVGDVQPAAPVAAFSGTPTAGEYPLAVQFTDQSTGEPTSWAWNFGDGATATTQNPSHTYAAAGTYTVSLTASNAYGSDTETKSGYITVTEPGTGGDALHVAAIAVSRKTAGPNVSGLCTVTIVDAGGAAVANATVTVAYDGPNSGSLSALTGSTGTASFETGKVRNPSGEWCFEVTGVSHATLAYDPAANAVTRSCESGTVYGADGRRLPGGFSLGPNSPNPFNPMTVIGFSLPRDTQVRLTVYDVRGRTVVSLVDGHLGAGEHHVTWDARNQPSGLYFYRLETPEFSQTRKMTMLK